MVFGVIPIPPVLCGRSGETSEFSVISKGVQKRSGDWRSAAGATGGGLGFGMSYGRGPNLGPTRRPTRSPRCCAGGLERARIWRV